MISIIFGYNRNIDRYSMWHFKTKYKTKNINRQYLTGMLIICLMQCIRPYYLCSQDTVFIDINKALEIAFGNNNNFNYLANKTLANKYTSEYPTDLNIDYGQLYTENPVLKLELIQNLGTPGHNKNERNSRAILEDFEKQKLALSKKQVEIEIKSLYLHWLYQMNVLQNIELKKEYSQKLIHVANVRNELGDTEFVELAKSQNQLSALEFEYQAYLIDIDITENKLRKYLGITEKLVPRNTKLELYMISKVSDTSDFNSNYFTDISGTNYKLAENNTKLIRTEKLPKFEVGMTYQKEYSPNSFNLLSIHAGISMPIFDKALKESEEKAQIQADFALQKLQHEKFGYALEIQNTILELDKIFLQTRHFENYEIPAANLILSTTTSQYQKEAIDFEEYMEKVNEALKIKRAYLDVINSYNQTALKLELFTKPYPNDEM
ncbi:MAG: TolC family protein [Bacteroidales bacterium]|nr:TolC family protein [Bacteroidales bacterium]MBN2820803.1 TolC family protein [Bacteroidales bacterium]